MATSIMEIFDSIHIPRNNSAIDFNDSVACVDFRTKIDVCEWLGQDQEALHFILVLI